MEKWENHESGMFGRVKGTMSETKFERVRFSDLVRDIEKDEIVLPDFQRGFVWKDKEKQKALIASVLTKLPIGTILLLEIEKDKYACKKIGLKNEKPDLSEVTGKIRALLDGQQRVTVLTAFFSNELYAIGDDSEFVAPSLRRRYFLRLPKIKKKDDRKDLFGCLSLVAPKKIEQKSYPDYSTDEIVNDIVFFDQPKYRNILYGDISNVESNELIQFCTNNQEEPDSYLIPLYYLYGAATKINTNQRNKLKLVIGQIAVMYHNEIIDCLKRIEDAEAEMIKQTFSETEDGKSVGERLKEDISSRTFKIREEDSDLYRAVSQLLEMRSGQWADDVREYLESCIDGLELYKIEVEQADILRAIDIYQNLNLGGKSLNVFDLILARAATQSENENLLQVVSRYILEDHRADYEIFKDNCDNSIKREYAAFLTAREEYSASEHLGAWIASENELSAGFLKALMSVVGTLDFFMDDDMGWKLGDFKRISSFTGKVTKSEYLLKIDPKRIDILVRKACKGMDRACFFLQMRCGIRHIAEIQYKLIFVILAVILSVDDWFCSKRICDYLETWYWSAILSGAFRREQNAAFADNLKELLKIVSAQSRGDTNIAPGYIIQLCKGVFCDEKFANEDILLVNHGFVAPEEVLTKTICQFYLAQTYSDILKQDAALKNYEKKQISVFTEFKEGGGLQKHHIMPIGELSTLYKDVERDAAGSDREDKRNIYNSPLNFAYISPRANKTILNNPLSYYADYCDNSTLAALGIETQNHHAVSNSYCELQDFLHRRYLHLCTDLRRMFAGSLEIQEAELDFYEKSRSKNRRE